MHRMFNLALFASVVAVGCSSSQGPGALPLRPVTGSLVVNGKPLDNIQVQLIPVGVDTKAKPGVATTDKDGKFVIRTNGDKGANPGKYKVVLGSSNASTPTGPVSLDEATKMSGQYAKTRGIPKVELPFPPEWGGEKTTPKEIEVADKPVEINIDI